MDVIASEEAEFESDEATEVPSIDGSSFVDVGGEGSMPSAPISPSMGENNGNSRNTSGLFCHFGKPTRLYASHNCCYASRTD